MLEGASEGPTVIAAYEAEILISLIPVVSELRKHGRDIGLERMTDSINLNQKDYYHFWVWSPSDEGVSPNVGHYSVNKHTAEIWNEVSEKKIDGEDIKAIQSILRKAHRITDQDIAQKSSIPLWAPDGQ